MNIGFVAAESPYSAAPSGGIAAYLRAIIPAFLDAGHRVTLFAGADKTEEFRAEDGRLEVHHLRLPAAHWYASKVPLLRGTVTLPLRQLEWSLAFYRQIARIAARQPFDVLESTEAGALFLHAIAPVVIRLHGSEAVFRKYASQPMDFSASLNDLLERRSCNKASAITAPSAFQANEVARARSWQHERVQIISNPISASMLEASSPASTPTDKDEPVILYVGRLAPVKGIDCLFAAAGRVHAARPRATFVLAGPWQMPFPPEKYGLELNRKSADGVLWIGPQHPKELVTQYRSATLFVMPSCFESFGISVVEAMAFRLPVVATRAGALPELVEHGITGELVTAGDCEAIANSILRLLDDPKARQTMGEAARERVVRNFTAQQIFKATLQVYSSLTSPNELEQRIEAETNTTSVSARA